MLNIDRVIQFLEDESNGFIFNMTEWLNTSQTYLNVCGTVACIGGTCDLIQLLDRDQENRPVTPLKEAFQWLSEGLNLPPLDSELLFMPETGSFHWGSTSDSPQHITREHAIACLKHLRDTGEIDWEGTKP